MGDVSTVLLKGMFMKYFLKSLSLSSSKANPLCGEVHQKAGVSHKQGKGFYVFYT